VKARPPITWDELVVLPVPGLAGVIARSGSAALPLASEAARNPFQRWAAQRSLHEQLHAAPAPWRFSMT